MCELIKIKKGLNYLLKNDSYLLENNLSERSITHKLAEYYQKIFFEWNVDCEYNKNLDEAKIINIDPEMLLRCMADYIESTKNHIKDVVSITNLEKQLRRPKIEYVRELDLVLFILKLTNGEIIKKTIFPDIIIHHRGTRDNYIVFEAKKSVNKNKESRFYDLIKLATLVNSPEYAYKKGVFIDIPVGNDFIGCEGYKMHKTPFPDVLCCDFI